MSKIRGGISEISKYGVNKPQMRTVNPVRRIDTRKGPRVKLRALPLPCPLTEGIPFTPYPVNFVKTKVE